jgi:hemerythrin superfamily protein
MSIADQQKQTEDDISPRSVIAVLQEQHSQIRQLLAQVQATRGADRRMSFDRLRELLAIHEAGEEIVLRPVTEDVAGEHVARARNDEERQAAKVLADLEGLDPDGAEFEQKFARFEQDVNEHAENEELEEFPVVNAAVDERQQRVLAIRLIEAEQKAPTHPHPGSAGSPAAQRVVGPFAALLDKARDSLAQRSG